MSKEKMLSFIIPCYRSENTVLKVVEEIEKTVVTRPGFSYEIILVNDGSPDNVWDVIRKRSESDEHVIGINLAKNFGQHSALLAGYNQCVGDYVVSLDDDGQTPADEVYSLIDELEKGYDIVFATYEKAKQTLFRRIGSRFAKAMSEFMFDIKGDDRQGSSYFVARKFVIKEMIKYKNPYPYMAGLILRTTRNISVVPVNHRERLEGTSGYSLKGLFSLWMNGFTAFSVKPLQMGTYIGFFFSFLGFLFAIVTIIRKLFITPNMEAGWSSTISILLVIGGVIMIMLGLIGEYVGRIYICINNSPQFVIKEISGSKDNKIDEVN